MNDNRVITNRDFASQLGDFRNACGQVGIEPTKRQASKWRNRKGSAYRFWTTGKKP